MNYTTVWWWSCGSCGLCQFVRCALGRLLYVRISLCILMSASTARHCRKLWNYAGLVASGCMALCWIPLPKTFLGQMSAVASAVDEGQGSRVEGFWQCYESFALPIGALEIEPNVLEERRTVSLDSLWSTVVCGSQCMQFEHANSRIPGVAMKSVWVRLEDVAVRWNGFPGFALLWTHRTFARIAETDAVLIYLVWVLQDVPKVSNKIYNSWDLPLGLLREMFSVDPCWPHKNFERASLYNTILSYII